MSEKDFDLICIGRSCVDLYSGEFGVPLERAMTFTKSVGGSPMNIAIGTSRLGLRGGAITGVGQEDNGRYLKWQLSCEGVDVSAVKTDPKRLTAMVLLSIRGDNDFPLIQYRENCADMGLTAEDIDPDYLARAVRILLQNGKAPDTVCGLVRNIGREGQSAQVLTLAQLEQTPVDMFTTVYIGNHNTRVLQGRMVTPRGYRV